MKLLKIKTSGIPLVSDGTEISFMAQQRVAMDERDSLQNLFSNIYVQRVTAFIGINASGKTTLLRLISFVISMLDNEPVNKIAFSDILLGQDLSSSAVIETYFYFEDTVYKLETRIGKMRANKNEKVRYVIEAEKLWAKNISSVKSKRALYDFDESMAIKVRTNSEEYLLDDVSIMIAWNREHGVSMPLYDTSAQTDVNWLGQAMDYPHELLELLDSHVEYLKCIPKGNGYDIRLRFKGSTDDIAMSRVSDINRYLSSGTVKGLNVFMQALYAMKSGGYLIVDELENHFNHELAATLMRFFMDRKINRHGAVLIFSTHYPEILDEFERNDNVYIVRNENGINAENLASALKRNDIKKSDAYQSNFLGGTAPAYESYIGFKDYLQKHMEESE